MDKLIGESPTQRSWDPRSDKHKQRIKKKSNWNDRFRILHFVKFRKASHAIGCYRRLNSHSLSVIPRQLTEVRGGGERTAHFQVSHQAAAETTNALTAFAVWQDEVDVSFVELRCFIHTSR